MPAALAPPRQQGHAPQRAAAPPPILIPFVAAAHEHVEPAFTWTAQPGASAIDSPEQNVPAYGYIRHVLLEVTAAGGVLGPGVAAADWPFNIFESISLYDVQGAPIFGPLDGYATFVANLIGGYSGIADPRRDGPYDNGANPTFHLRIPVEISHSDGMGAISNQSAAAEYKVRLRFRPAAQIYTTAPTTVPTFTVRAFLEAWSVPDVQDIQGNPQQQAPPLHGTSQFWSSNNQATVAGRNTLRSTRVGSFIRALAFIARDVSGVRTAAAFPDPIRFTWDGRDLYNGTRLSLEKVFRERTWPDKYVEDTYFPGLVGVYAFLFNHAEKNSVGDGPPSLWLKTVQSSRLEIDGTIVTPGTLQFITNDIAPVEVQPAERFVQSSQTGFVPDVGTPAATPAGR